MPLLRRAILPVEVLRHRRLVVEEEEWVPLEEQASSECCPLLLVVSLADTYAGGPGADRPGCRR